MAYTTNYFTMDMPFPYPRGILSMEYPVQTLTNRIYDTPYWNNNAISGYRFGYHVLPIDQYARNCYNTIATASNNPQMYSSYGYFKRKSKKRRSRSLAKRRKKKKRRSKKRRN